MTFTTDLEAFTAKVNKRAKAIHQVNIEEVERSVKWGSAITGAPGQPVQSGKLRGSWQPKFLGPLLWEIGTPTIYAPVIEEGQGQFGALTQRSSVGGFHSVKLTRAGWQKIVDHSVREVVRD